MNCLHQRSAFLPQLIDGIQFQDRVVHHDTARHDDTDGRHQVQGMSEHPQRSQGKRNVYRDFHQHDERLEETLELRTQDEVHQQDGHEENHGQFSDHLLIREETTREVHFPTVRFAYHFLDVFHQLRRIIHLKEVHRDILTVLPCGNTLQVFRRYHLDQAAQRNIIGFPLGVRLGLHEGSSQDVIDGPFFSGNAYRQILLVRTQGRHLVFLECRTEYPGQFVVCHMVEQQPLPIHHQIHLVTESDAFRRESGTLHNLLFQVLKHHRVGCLRTVVRV